MNRFLLLLLLATPWLGSDAFAQNLIISKKSAKYFSQEQMRNLIHEYGWEAVREYQIPKEVYEREYRVHEKELLIAIRPVLVKRFAWADFTGGNDRSLYEKEIYKGVRDVILNNFQFHSLYLYDQTDRILNFASDIHIAGDGKVLVTERIRIYNGSGEQNYMAVRKGSEREVNNSIVHGLAREFPTLYTTREGLYVEVPFEVKTVSLDGQPQSYFRDKLDNGVRLRIGDAAKFLEEGIHEFRITYETANQLIFHENKDEFYWNVNGNGWEFTADSVSANVVFPGGAKIFEQACYTGPQNSTESDCQFRLMNDSTIVFSANNRLMAYSGLTIAASVQKGILVPPSTLGVFWGMIIVNWPLSAMLIVLVVLFLINLFNWFRIGRDPGAGNIYPRFEAPDRISPADAGYLYKQKFLPRHFSAALVDIAVRKGVRITVSEEGKLIKSKVYSLHRSESKSRMIESYVKQSYDWSIRDLWGQTLRKEYNSKIGDMYSALATHLERQFRTDHEHYSGRRGFFAWNAGAGAWGFILLGALALASFVVIGSSFTAVHAIVMAVLFAIGFIMQYVFYRIMPAYNKEGRAILDQILGLRMYLVTAEERRFDKLQPPEKNLDLFEKFLPYAIALECENEWAKKFETIIADAVANKEYRPAYYDGNLRDVSDMGSSFSSGLSSVVSSASTAPSEGGSDGSGGSDGGGSSGGGGGGGGGGGW